MATFDITVAAQSAQGEDANIATPFSVPGDADGATIDDVSIVGSPTITSDSSTDDTIGVRWRIQTNLDVAVFGDFDSDAASVCFGVLGNFATSFTIQDGSARSPNPSTIVSADWDEIAFFVNYTANMMADAELCSWSAFTIRVTYTPAVNNADGAPSIILPTAAGAAEVISTATGAPSIILPTAAGSAFIWPRVYLNTSQTKSGSTEMTVTDANAAGTSITFDDAVGAPTGALFLGVERQSDDLIGWIAVTVNVAADETADGAPSIILPTAAGTAEVINTATGSPSIILPTAAGTAGIDRSATGAPSITLPTSTGAAEIIKPATGAPSIILPTSAGTAEIIKTATGAPSIILPTAAGVADADAAAGPDETADGAPSIILPTAQGAAEIVKTADGAPSIILPTAAGAAEITKTATGSPSIILPTAAGTAGIDRSATGAPSIPLLTASGTAEILNTATGAPSITLPTASGAATITGTATGAPSITLPIAAGAATITGTATGAPSIILPTAAGAAEIVKTATGAPEIPLITSAGVSHRCSEILPPDAIVAIVGLSGDVTDIDEPVNSPDGNWLLLAA